MWQKVYFWQLILVCVLHDTLSPGLEYLMLLEPAVGHPLPQMTGINSGWRCSHHGGGNAASSQALQLK